MKEATNRDNAVRLLDSRACVDDDATARTKATVIILII
jgi:hypothetical protein